MFPIQILKLILIITELLLTQFFSIAVSFQLPYGQIFSDLLWNVMNVCGTL